MDRSGNARASSPTRVRASSTGVVVPLPPHSRNSTGRQVGRQLNGNATTIPTITHRLPRAVTCPGWDASWVQNAPWTLVPRRRNRLSSTARCRSVSAGTRVATISRAIARPSWSADQAWAEKNRCARWWLITVCIPVPISMPVMVHAPVWVIIPTVSRQKTSNGRSRKQDRNPCSSTASEPGTVSPGSISGSPHPTAESGTADASSPLPTSTQPDPVSSLRVPAPRRCSGRAGR